MSYAQIDTRAARHLKLARVSGDAFRLWVQGLCFVQDQKTDGFIPSDVIPSLGLPLPRPELVNELVTGRLWHNVRGGYEIHDYLQWNASASERAKKSSDSRSRSARYRERLKASQTIDTRAVQRELPPAESGPVFGGDFDDEPAVMGAMTTQPAPPLPVRPVAPPPTMRGHRSALGNPVMEYDRLKTLNGYVGVRFRVPMHFHKELVGRYGGDEAAAEQALAGFYRALDDSLGENDSIPSIYPFINGHFAKFVADRAASVPPAGGVARRADDQRAPVDASMREQLSNAANKKP